MASVGWIRRALAMVWSKKWRRQRTLKRLGRYFAFNALPLRCRPPPHARERRGTPLMQRRKAAMRRSKVMPRWRRSICAAARRAHVRSVRTTTMSVQRSHRCKRVAYLGHVCFSTDRSDTMRLEARLRYIRIFGPRRVRLYRVVGDALMTISKRMIIIWLEEQNLQGVASGEIQLSLRVHLNLLFDNTF
jgi:hypothetical protein